MAKKVSKMFMAMIGGKETDEEVFEEVYRELCRDIRRERARVGGDWVVAGVLNTPHARQVVRSELGPEVEMVVLNMAGADQEARVAARHVGDEALVDVMKVGQTEEVTMHPLSRRFTRPASRPSQVRSRLEVSTWRPI